MIVWQHDDDDESYNKYYDDDEWRNNTFFRFSKGPINQSNFKKKKWLKSENTSPIDLRTGGSRGSDF